jgi:hypothetical protein
VAYQDSNAVLSAPAAHPSASPGYGKRTAQDQPRTAAGFAHLPPREAYIAAFVDRLPDGAAMDVKSLAKVLPLYGQQAVRTALNALSRAGHLRRVRGLAATADSGTRWVFRTYWSRTARDDDWWAAFLDGRALPDSGPDAPCVNPAPVPVTPATVSQPQASRPQTQPEPTPDPSETHTDTAYRILARLGTFDSRLALSAVDCDALTDLVVPWLERGASTVYVIKALTGGLPDPIHSPRGFVARRLQDKLPPFLAPAPVAPEESPAAADPAVPPPNRLMPTCTECGVPGRPAAFVGGLCRGCRSATDAAHDAHPASLPSPRPARMNRHTALAHAREALAAGRERRHSAKVGPVTAGRV